MGQGMLSDLTCCRRGGGSAEHGNELAVLAWRKGAFDGCWSDQDVLRRW